MKKVKLPSIKLSSEEISARIQEVYPEYPELVSDIAKKLANKRFDEVKGFVGYIILTGYAFCKTKDTSREISLSFIHEKAWITAQRITDNEISGLKRLMLCMKKLKRQSAEHIRDQNLNQNNNLSKRANRVCWYIPNTNRF